MNPANRRRFRHDSLLLAAALAP